MTNRIFSWVIPDEGVTITRDDLIQVGRVQDLAVGIHLDGVRPEGDSLIGYCIACHRGFTYAERENFCEHLAPLSDWPKESP